MKITEEKQANGKPTDAVVSTPRKADVPTRLAILHNLRQLHLLFLGLFSGK